jgi:hypothetical protein
MKKLGVLLVLVGCLASASPAFGQATRTWVSAVGDDVNPCSRTAPCKTWAGAISKTATGGEIDAMDDGGFGALTITKSITIDGGGHLASTLASGQNGFLVNIPVNVNDPHRRVVLRNLSINGSGSSGTVGTSTGLNGISLVANGARSLALESIDIFNFTQDGINLAPAAAAPTEIDVSLDDVSIAQVDGNGIEWLAPDADHKLNLWIQSSKIRGVRGTTGTAGETGIGVSADTGAHVWLTGTSIFDNPVGLKAFARKGAAGMFDSYCDNQIGNNVDDGDEPNELCPQPAPGPAATPTPTPTPTATPQPVAITKEVAAPVTCKVPNLRGVSSSVAKRLLRASHCTLGVVTKRKAGKRSQVGKVISQTVKAGTTLTKGAKVGVTIRR